MKSSEKLWGKGRASSRSSSRHRREADPVAERRAAGRGDLNGSTCPLRRPLSIGSALTVHREWSFSRTSVLTPPNRIKHDAGGRDRIAALHREPQSATSKGTSCGSLPCPMYRRNSIAFPGRPAYVGGSSRAAGHFAARPTAEGKAQRRYSTRRDGGPREPGKSRSGSAGVTNHADSGGSGRASGTAGSRAHTRRARARARRQFPARSPHRIVEPAAGAGGIRRRSSPSGPSGDPDGPEGIRKRSCGGGVHAEQVVSRPHERLRLARVVGRAAGAAC